MSNAYYFAVLNKICFKIVFLSLREMRFSFSGISSLFLVHYWHIYIYIYVQYISVNIYIYIYQTLMNQDLRIYLQECDGLSCVTGKCIPERIFSEVCRFWIFEFDARRLIGWWNSFIRDIVRWYMGILIRTIYVASIKLYIKSSP